MKTRQGNNHRPLALYWSCESSRKCEHKKEFCGVHIKRANTRKNLRKPEIAPIYARARVWQKCGEMRNIKKSPGKLWSRLTVYDTIAKVKIKKVFIKR